MFPLISAQKIFERHGIEIGVGNIVQLPPHGQRHAFSRPVAVHCPRLNAGHRRQIILYAAEYLAPVACIKEGEIQCDRSGVCLTVPMWKELDDITNAYLDTVSLEDLLTGDKWRQQKAVH